MSTNSFKDYVAEKSAIVNRILDQANVNVKEPTKLLQESIMYASQAARSSKRVRAALCIASCELVGGEESSALPAACALEMIHVSLCIIVDLPHVHNKSVRWGKPTNHKVFGESVAMLSGLALGAQAVDHLVNGCAKFHVPSHRIVKAVGEMAKFMSCDGLIVKDYNSSNSVKPGVIEMLEHMNELVTGVNIRKQVAELEASLVLGAILGGANDQQIEKLRDFAKCVGSFMGLIDYDYDDEGGAKCCKDVQTVCQKLKVDAMSHIDDGGFNTNKIAPLMSLVDGLVNLSV